MKIGELFLTLGIDAETTKVKDFVNAVAELPVEAVGALAALGGISFELTKIAEESINAAVGFQMFTNQTGLSSQELQRWQIVAEQANVSSESVAQSVNSLQRNLANIRMGRGDIAPFQLLGISANQDAFKVLEQLRSRIQGLDRATATNLVTRMGISADMMNVLTLPEQQFKKFSETVRGQTEEQSKEFLKAKLTLTQFSMVVKELGMNFLANLVNGIGTLIDHLQRLRGGMIGLGVVIGGLVIAFAPLTAALTLLALILEDLAVWAMGGKSLFKEAFEGLKTIFQDPIASAKVLLDLIDQIVNKLTGKSLKQGFADLKAATMQLINDPEGVGIVLADILKTGKLNPYDQPVPALAGAGGGNRTITQHNDVHILVQGSGSPEDTARATKREYDRAVNAATIQLDNGGH